MPTDHGQLDADSRAGVPVHERGEGQDEPRHPGNPIARAPEAVRRAAEGSAVEGRIGLYGVAEIFGGFHRAKYGD